MTDDVCTTVTGCPSLSEAFHFFKSIKNLCLPAFQNLRLINMELISLKISLRRFLSLFIEKNKKILSSGPPNYITHRLFAERRYHFLTTITTPVNPESM
jgi:hypothetical protein